ncbi:inorganic phosphate transporter [Micrococcus sp.]|uniref:inorganic phosphate transporter n=1 Tax=Micrococcus sp. TaxID=1271 RepID=UPI002A919118|nr:inorganic phosphate transporter [Micrococcus sp.]MDY6056030.1 inorganic phosphate transporter [Micrococcus sp.]
MTAPLVGVLALLVLLAGLMGFRDAPNAVALPVRHGALTPRVSLVMAAVLNGAGASLGILLVAVGVRFVEQHVGSGGPGLLTVAAGLVTVLLWGVLLWWRRIPASTTSALIAALAGAHLAAHVALGAPLDERIGQRMGVDLAVGLVFSPLLAWALARVITRPVVGLATTGTTVNVQRRARIALAVSGGTTAFGHGVQSGQRLGVLWAASVLAAGGPSPVPEALTTVLLALAVAAGTLGGAWRIAWTLTERLTDLDPLRAAVATVVPAALIFVGTMLLHVPLSSSHTVAAGVVGAGQTQTYASVRWPQVLRVLGWWLLTPVLCGAVAYGLALGLVAAIT